MGTNLAKSCPWHYAIEHFFSNLSMLQKYTKFSVYLILCNQLPLFHYQWYYQQSAAAPLTDYLGWNKIALKQCSDLTFKFQTQIYELEHTLHTSSTQLTCVTCDERFNFFCSLGTAAVSFFSALVLDFFEACDVATGASLLDCIWTNTK